MAVESVTTARVIAFPRSATSGVARLVGQVRDILGDEQADVFAASLRLIGSSAEQACHAMADRVERLLRAERREDARRTLHMASVLV